MKLIRLFLSSLTVLLASASTLAPDLPDGVYQSYTDDNGLEVHMQHSYSNEHERHLPLLSWTHDPNTPSLNSSSQPAEHSSHLNDDLEKRNDCSPLNINWKVFCGCSFPVDHANCDSAVADLKNQVGPDGHTFTNYMNYYSKRTNVVAFICSFDPRGLNVGPSLITIAAEQITDRCGWYIAGTYMPTYNGALNVPGLDIGYMQYTSGLDFCANARNSGQNCC